MWEDEQSRNQFASFMRSAPEKLFQDPDGAQSTETGGPTSFSKHLGSLQVLKRVVYLPHLSSHISDAVNRQLDSLLQEGKRLAPATADKHFPLESFRRLDEAALPDTIRYETGVVEHYMRSTGFWCSRVASTMLLHPSSSKWCSPLTCTTDPSRDAQKGAKADLYLTILPKFADMRAELGLSREDHEMWKAVQQRFPFIMPFEMKNLKVGNYDVLDTILKLGCSGDITFPWVCCTGCTSHAVSDAPLGPDAQGIGEGVLSNSPPPDDNDDYWDACPSPATTFFGGSRVSSIYESTFPGPHPPSQIQSPRGKTKPEHATRILQQIWSEAVRIDATFMVLHCGNHQIIGVRHRKSQTLYITEVIDVGTFKGYSQLQTGLYLCALQDALKRSKIPPPKRSMDCIPPLVKLDSRLLESVVSPVPPKSRHRPIPSAGTRPNADHDKPSPHSFDSSEPSFDGITRFFDPIQWAQQPPLFPSTPRSTAASLPTPETTPTAKTQNSANVFRNSLNERLPDSDESRVFPRPESRYILDYCYPHQRFYFDDGTTVFQVDTTLFCVHRYFLEKYSEHFRAQFNLHPHGGTLGDPFVLEGCTCQDFELILRVFYPEPEDFCRNGFTKQEWISLMRLAFQWKMPSVSSLAQRHLVDLLNDPIEKIRLQVECQIEDNWALNEYINLTERTQQVTLKEAKLLGVRATLIVERCRNAKRFKSPFPTREVVLYYIHQVDQCENQVDHASVEALPILSCSPIARTTTRRASPVLEDRPTQNQDASPFGMPAYPAL